MIRVVGGELCGDLGEGEKTPVDEGAFSQSLTRVSCVSLSL